MKHARSSTTFRTHGGTAVPNQRILVVDDEEQIRNLFMEFFTGLGYDVVTVGTGREALEKFKPGLFDCIISDFAMPEMDGMELLQKVSAKDKKVIFLMVTGYPTVERAVEAIKSGAYDYITKPFNMKEIRIKVEKALYTCSL
jgi:DNA-binding NtrC family response regulator